MTTSPNTVPVKSQFLSPSVGFDEIRAYAMKMAGMTFHLRECEVPHADGQGVKFDNNALALPIEVVCGLVNQSYTFPNQKQAVLDALSPFQVLSKLWVTKVLSDILSRDGVQTERQFIMPGAWFGVQHSLMRRNTKIRMKNNLLIDMDATAHCICKEMLTTDVYAGQSGVKCLHEDIFNLARGLGSGMDTDIWDKRESDAVYVWNGLEHFDPELVKWFVAREKNAMFCLQSTDMDAEDHKFKCHSVWELLNYVPDHLIDQVKYAGTIECGTLGSRFMVIF